MKERKPDQVQQSESPRPWGRASAARGEIAVRQESEVDRARATVLVVDDDAALRQLLEDILVRAGFEVVLAGTGVNLAKIVRQQHPNVVLLDEVMEPVSGLEALQALRASGQDVPVVMLTAIRHDEMVEAALDTGADDYLTKPFSDAVLVAHLRAVLRREHWRASNRNSRPEASTPPRADAPPAASSRE